MPFYDKGNEVWQIWWTRPDREFGIKLNGKEKLFHFESKVRAHAAFAEQVAARVADGWTERGKAPAVEKPAKKAPRKKK
jgi:hypothetical protein